MKLNARQNAYEDVTPYKCVMCEEHEEAHYFNNKRMVDSKLCFTCNFWDELVEQVDKTIRIKGNHYMLGANGNKPGPYNGFGGRKFTIRMNRGEIIETCDLWYQGAIPETFKDKMPDNATFVEYPAPIGHGQGFLG